MDHFLTGPKWFSECKVYEAFNQRSYKPAPGGFFTFKVSKIIY